MKISELVQELQEIADEYGDDLDVKVDIGSKVFDIDSVIAIADGYQYPTHVEISY